MFFLEEYLRSDRYLLGWLRSAFNADLFTCGNAGVGTDHAIDADDAVLILWSAKDLGGGVLLSLSR
jgi:hypothetical protein